MSIYTDGVHVVSDVSLDELHRYAERVLNLGRHWFHKGRWPHYDLPKTSRGQCKFPRGSRLPGARTIETKELIEVMRNGLILDELIAEDRAIGGITHPERFDPYD